MGGGRLIAEPGRFPDNVSRRQHMRFIGSVEQVTIDPVGEHPRVHIHLVCELEAEAFSDLLVMMSMDIATTEHKQWPMSLGED
jgi:hypothetical protein